MYGKSSFGCQRSSERSEIIRTREIIEGAAILAQNALKNDIYAAKNVKNHEKQHNFFQFLAKLPTNLQLFEFAPG